MYVSDTIQQQDPSVAPVAPKGSNGFAITSLITGIIGIWPLGIIFGVLGLVRAGKVNKGKVMSWIGIVLSIVWLGVSAFLLPHITKALDPGCRVAITTHGNYPDSKVNADAASNPQAFGVDLQAEIAGFTEAAGKAKNADAKAAMTAEVTDLQAILQAAAAGQQPTADVVAKANTDENVLTKACRRLLVRTKSDPGRPGRPAGAFFVWGHAADSGDPAYIARRRVLIGEQCLGGGVRGGGTWPVGSEPLSNPPRRSSAA